MNQAASDPEATERTSSREEANAGPRSAYGNLLERIEALEALVLAVTHDLKNPVSIVSLLARDLLETHAQHLGPEGRRSLERILARAGEVEDMLHDLLLLFRTGGAAEPERAVDLNRLVADTIEQLRPHTERKGVRIRAGHLPAVHGQERKLARAVANLIANAVNYAPAGRGEVEIRSTGATNGTATICIRDNGDGIDRQFHDRIFDPFTRVPGGPGGGTTPPGSGVGLAIVKRVIEEHRGRVWVDSKRGRGAAFYVSLPAAQD